MDSGPRKRLSSGVLAAGLPAAVKARSVLWEAGTRPWPTTAFRLVHAQADSLPGLTVDVYGRYAVANLTEEAAGVESEVLDALFALDFNGVYLKRHPRQKNALADTDLAGLCPPRPARGRPAPAELVVQEYGVPFGVRLADGLRTGLFLDQRENRRRIAALARGGRLLNLFAYTGGFSVAALHNGAEDAVCVDVSATALARARENVARIGAARRHRTITDDVFDVLARLRRRGERFDVVVVDPPSYATTKRRRFTAVKGYPELVALALPLLTGGGHLLCCLNHHTVSSTRFRDLVAAGARAAKVVLSSMQDLVPPADFPTADGMSPLFKALLCQRPG